MPLHAASRGFGEAANGLEADMRTKVQRHKPALGSRQPAACSITRLNISVITQKYENRRKLLQLIWVIQAIFTARCHSTKCKLGQSGEPLGNQSNQLEICRVFYRARDLAPPFPHSAAPSSCRLAITCAIAHAATCGRRHTAGCRLYTRQPQPAAAVSQRLHTAQSHRQPPPTD